jgi:hypothetical protein
VHFALSSELIGLILVEHLLKHRHSGNNIFWNAINEEVAAIDALGGAAFRMSAGNGQRSWWCNKWSDAISRPMDRFA